MNTQYPSFLGVGDFVYRSTPVPVFERADGSYLYDGDGRVYLDAEAANGTAGLGYDPTIIEEAVQRTMQLPGIPSFCETDIRLHVAERLNSMFEQVTGVPGRVAFELGGAQAMELAIKIAKSGTGKSNVVVFAGGYHGRSIYTSQLSASKRYREFLSEPKGQILRLPFPRVGGAETEALDEEDCLKYVRWLLSTEAGGLVDQNGDADICALVLEPVLNVGGMVVPDVNFLNELVQMFTERGVKIVVDEIFTGMYRTGPMWGFQRYSFCPDMIVTSKGLSNGVLPVSVVWARDPLMDADHFPPGTHSITYGNNPLSIALIEVVLDRYATIAPRIENFSSTLEKCLGRVSDRHNLIKHVEIIGGIGKVVLRRDIAHRVRETALTIASDDSIDGVHGLLVASTGMGRDVVCIHPPFTFETREFRLLGELLSRTLDHLGGGEQ